ncbi:SDR family oxidoreductase [Pseudoduganella ginsengisoli]|uniref:SDR family oxidoreductase n=1 Tax=Pseudoduganella ginsengisoli TaxID=1462440 RepID=A0A6L6Q7C0_9BURK|nr:SDR family oxidoreductase [Pseudoduganella ginsengisoli]MTW05118.1 SDR family oxidoreductase [Pseudoduganella ginsengisoli]
MATLPFEQKTALVTGASSGIGFATAQAFLAQGARRVYITGRDHDKLHSAAATLGERALPVAADSADAASLAQLHAAIAQRGDRLDVLFANAGVATNNAFGDTSPAAYSTLFDINVKGVFFTVQTLLPLLNDGAAVVLNASIAGNLGMPNLSLYNASKAAVRSFARSWASDLKERRIRVNAISPGVTRTPILQTGLAMNDAQIEGVSQMLAHMSPAGRMADAEEIAAAVLFLASPAASYVNGVELVADGGFSQV